MRPGHLQQVRANGRMAAVSDIKRSGSCAKQSKAPGFAAGEAR